MAFPLIHSHPSHMQLKQMKELEQEKDSLLAGLEVVERARDWYQGQIHNVTERQRQVGQNSQSTVCTEHRVPERWFLYVQLRILLCHLFTGFLHRSYSESHECSYSQTARGQPLPQ